MVKATGGGGARLQAAGPLAELVEAFARVIAWPEPVSAPGECSSSGTSSGPARRGAGVRRRAGAVIALATGTAVAAPQPEGDRGGAGTGAAGPGARPAARIGDRALRCGELQLGRHGRVVYDADREEASFLRGERRLQVEHPVTEQVFGVDLVEWMLRLAQGEDGVLTGPRSSAGASVEARIYAGTPAITPASAGLLTQVRFPPEVRVEELIETGTEIGTAYDPLLAS